MENIANIFYGILFEPSETFKIIPIKKPYKLPLAIVILASLFLLVLSEHNFGFGTIFAFIFKSIGLIIYWLFFAFFVDLMARMFGVVGNYTKLLTLSAFSFLPWVFLAPLKLLKNAFDATSDIAVLFILGIWFWTIALQVIAISETYNVPRKNAIIILLIPFLGMVVYFGWLVDFFVKLSQIAGL